MISAGALCAVGSTGAGACSNSTVGPHCWQPRLSRPKHVGPAGMPVIARPSVRRWARLPQPARKKKWACLRETDRALPWMAAASCEQTIAVQRAQQVMLEPLRGGESTPGSTPPHLPEHVLHFADSFPRQCTVDGHHLSGRDRFPIRCQRLGRFYDVGHLLSIDWLP